MIGQPVKVYKATVGLWRVTCDWCPYGTGGWSTRAEAETAARAHLSDRHVPQLVKVYR